MNSYLSYGLQTLRLTTTFLLSSLCRVNIITNQSAVYNFSIGNYVRTTTTAVKTSVKKMNFLSFKLNRIYLDPIWTR